MTIAVLATCMAQAFRPGVADAILELGNRLGLAIEAPPTQTCCGLPAYQAGKVEAARVAAHHLLRVFDSYDAIVTPSPGCLRMARQHIPALLADTPEASLAQALAAHAVTWVDYLVEQVGVDRLQLSFTGAVVYVLSLHTGR